MNALLFEQKDIELMAGGFLRSGTAIRARRLFLKLILVYKLGIKKPKFSFR
jgi:hypothetical protein